MNFVRKVKVGLIIQVTKLYQQFHDQKEVCHCYQTNKGKNEKHHKNDLLNSLLIISIIDLSHKNKAQVKIIIVEAVTNYEWRIITKIKVGKNTSEAYKEILKCKTLLT